MPVSRRRMLQFLGVVPAVPLLSKIPTVEIPLPENHNLTAIAPCGFTGSGMAHINLGDHGGFCAPMAPLYDLPAESRPVRDSLPAIKARRGGIRYR